LHYLKLALSPPPEHTHIQIDQIAGTFDTAIMGYRTAQDHSEFMQSINDAVAFVQTTVCVYTILCAHNIKF